VAAGLLPKLFGTAGNFEVIVFGLLMVLVLHRPAAACGRSSGQALVPVRRPKPSTRCRWRCRGAACRRPASLILEAKDGHAQVRRPGRQQQHEPGGAGGRDPGPDRPQRRGQEHDVQPALGRGYADLGRGAFLGKSVAGKGSREIARMGMSRTFQHVRLLPTMSVLENVAIGAHMRGDKGVLSAAWRLDRAEEARLLKPRPPARSSAWAWASTCTPRPAASPWASSASSRSRVRCAPTPACCCSTSRPPACATRRSRRSATCCASCARRHGVLIVEHDMDFVMGLVDRVVVMEFGEKIAEGLPDDVQQRPGRARGLSGMG
jgi:branched-chain amino acid transport system permease protein